jgi:thymidylate synthase
MVLLNESHLFQTNTDVVCTYAINFTIMRGELHMTVMMRSNDVIFGFTNDAFCFWNLYIMMYAVLLKNYPGLQIGTYTHFTNSMHVYERHFEMIDQIVRAGADGYAPVQIPYPDHKEVWDLIFSKGQHGTGTYTSFLKT